MHTKENWIGSIHNPTPKNTPKTSTARDQLGDLVAYNARLRTVHRQLAADRFPPGTGPRSWRGRRVSLKYRRPSKSNGLGSKKNRTVISWSVHRHQTYWKITLYHLRDWYGKGKQEQNNKTTEMLYSNLWAMKQQRHNAGFGNGTPFINVTERERFMIKTSRRKRLFLGAFLAPETIWFLETEGASLVCRRGSCVNWRAVAPVGGQAVGCSAASQCISAEIQHNSDTCPGEMYFDIVQIYHQT